MAERAHWAFSWFQTPWQAQPSRRAPQGWAELGADGPPEITEEMPRANWPPETEIIEEGEVIVPPLPSPPAAGDLPRLRAG